MNYPNLNALAIAVKSIVTGRRFHADTKNTYCNQAVNAVALAMGFKHFAGLLANDMVELMEQSPLFTPVPMDLAHQLAAAGFLLIAGRKGRKHGHVVVILPGIPAWSGKWKQQCPRCLDIGDNYTVGEGINWAFSAKPKIWMMKNLPPGE